MRLIDADEVRKKLLMIECMEDAVEIIDATLTAYDVDKVVDRLKQNAIFVDIEDAHLIPESNVKECYEAEVVELWRAIEIVKAGGVNG